MPTCRQLRSMEATSYRYAKAESVAWRQPTPRTGTHRLIADHALLKDFALRLRTRRKLPLKSSHIAANAYALDLLRQVITVIVAEPAPSLLSGSSCGDKEPGRHWFKENAGPPLPVGATRAAGSARSDGVQPLRSGSMKTNAARTTKPHTGKKAQIFISFFCFPFVDVPVLRSVLTSRQRRAMHTVPSSYLVICADSMLAED